MIPLFPQKPQLKQFTLQTLPRQLLPTSLQEAVLQTGPVRFLVWVEHSKRRQGRGLS